MLFQPGDRVRVSLSFSWAKGALGTVDIPPPSVQELVEDSYPYAGCSRIVPTCDGFEQMVWVVFDTPQKDEDGHGPYEAASIPADMLEHISQVE